MCGFWTAGASPARLAKIAIDETATKARAKVRDKGFLRETAAFSVGRAVFARQLRQDKHSHGLKASGIGKTPGGQREVPALCKEFPFRGIGEIRETDSEPS